MQEIINLTPHSISIMNEKKEIILVVPPSGKVAKLDSDKELVKTEKTFWLDKNDKIIEGLIYYYSIKYGIPILIKMDKEGKEINRFQFPEMKKNVIYIVSGVFRSGYPRSDLWQPGELVRNDKGIPIGCFGLSQ